MTVCVGSSYLVLCKLTDYSLRSVAFLVSVAVPPLVFNFCDVSLVILFISPVVFVVSLPFSPCVL
jgi:hypothetical protein